VCGRASESTIIGLMIPESATGIVITFDICRFQGVTALALTTLWKPWVLPLIIIRTRTARAKSPCCVGDRHDGVELMFVLQ
jgi:hypothetical protein